MGNARRNALPECKIDPMGPIPAAAIIGEQKPPDRVRSLPPMYGNSHHSDGGGGLFHITSVRL